MIFSYNWLQSFFEKKLPKPEKLAQILEMRAFEVESIEKKGKDFVLDIKVLPNRGPDCFSHFGIAKEIGAILDLKLKPFPKVKIKPTKTKLDNFEIKIENKEDCQRYGALFLSNVKVKESPKWLQERLISCGLQPINNIVDVTNYVMLEIGQPCHAFDFDKISKRKQSELNKSLTLEKNLKKWIIVKRAKKGDKILALDEKEYELDNDILVIAAKPFENNSENILAIAGIKGGKESAIDAKTRNVLVEMANFNPTLIRRASQKLKLKTDASIRFEHSLDQNLILLARERIIALIKELKIGDIGPFVDVSFQKTLPKKIRISFDFIRESLGCQIKEDLVIKILRKLDFKVKREDNELLVEVPTTRLDINLPIDLVEEVGRIYGFENIEPVFPFVNLVLAKENEEIKLLNLIKRTLKEEKFFEVYNYSFISKEDKEKFSLEKLIELENPISSLFQYLRSNLIINLLKNIKDNQKNIGNSNSEIRFFEAGKVFSKDKNIQEKKVVSGVIFTNKNEEFFYELKGIVEVLLKNLFIFNTYYDDEKLSPLFTPLDFWHDKKRAIIRADNEAIGFIGEIHPAILKKIEIEEGRVFAFEFDFEKLFKFSQKELEYEELPKYSPVIRDLSVLIPQETKLVEVLNIIENTGKEILYDVDLIDTYSGDNIEEGKESVTFRLIYLDKNKQLTSEEVDKIHQKIIKELEKNKNWKVRK